MFKRNAFTMIELIFVIVIMGIIGKFGVEFLAQAYQSFIFSKVNHTLQSTSGISLELIAAKLQNRIKDSVIARVGISGAAVSIGSADGSSTDYTVLEWIGSDYEGFRGNSSGSVPYNPNWSGIIDVNHLLSTTTNLVSPETNTTAIDNMIDVLSYGNASIANAALYFIGSNSVAPTDYGWDSVAAMTDQTKAMHPVTSTAVAIDQFLPSVGNFGGVDVYEYYQLAWTAYAIVYEAGPDNLGTLRLYWNYQPWEGETIDKAKSDAVIMENVSTFQFISIGDILKIQVCTKSTIITGDNDGDGYSLCKEKTVL